MDKREIIAQSEAVDAIVGNFNQGLENYLNDMNREYEALSRNTSTLSALWSGELSDKFSDNIAVQMATLRGSLEQGKELLERLKTTQAQMAEAVRLLKAAAEGEDD